MRLRGVVFSDGAIPGIRSSRCPGPLRGGEGADAPEREAGAIPGWAIRGRSMNAELGSAMSVGLAMTLVAGPCATAGELLVNGGFEGQYDQNGLAPNWKDNSYSSKGPIEVLLRTRAEP